MKIRHAPRRYVATPGLRQVIRSQGRRMNWLSAQLGVSESQMSKIVAGTRTVAEPDARILATLVGGDFRVLFECPDGLEIMHSTPIRSRQPSAA